MRVALLGDTAFFGRHCPEADPGCRGRLEELRSHLAGYDMVVANLEAPICRPLTTHGAKSAHIRSGEGSATLLRWLGVTHVSLANNHAHDFGAEGLRQTIASLNSEGIEWFGVGARPEIDIDIAGARLRLAGYCAYSSSPAARGMPDDVALSPFDLDVARRQVEEARAEKRLPILAVHSGLEHIPMPSAEDVAAARGLAGVGDYVYYGHHPHVIQGIEAVGRSLLIYSLGNAIFDDVYTPKDPEKPLVAMSDDNKNGLIVSFTVEGDELRDWSAIRLHIGENGIAILGDAADYILPINRHLDDAGTPAYRARRAEHWSRHVANRKRRRDLRFYLARMKISSAFYLLAARRNARLQRRHVDEKLGTFGAK